MSKLRVGVDLDGCLFCFHSSFKRYAKIAGKLPATGHSYIGDWHFYRKWGMGDKEFVELCNQGADEGYIFSGGVKRDGAYAMWRIKQAGAEIHIITDRSFGSTPSVSHDLTRAWLTKYSIPYDTLTFSADKTSVPVDMMVEDKLENYDALVAAGVEAYLITRPWNHDPEYGLADGRNRIQGIQHFAHHVERRATGKGGPFALVSGGARVS